MARIRTIKPEFPQSESMGRVSRDARLLFIMLWTICDDYGRTRAASRMLASLLYPYDTDAASLLDGWLAELDAEGCIRLYEVDGSRYLEICKWLNHQKVDRPSASKFPAFDESSRVFSNPRESLAKVSVGSGPRTKDQGMDQGGEGEGTREPAPTAPPARRRPPPQPASDQPQQPPPPPPTHETVSSPKPDPAKLQRIRDALDVATNITPNWEPDEPTLERLRMDGILQPGQRAPREVVVAFRAHHEAQGTLRIKRLWGAEFAKWMARQRTYDTERAARNPAPKVYDKPLEFPEDV